MAAEMWPPANTITMSADPIASGASSGGALVNASPMAKTRKNVP